MRQWSIREAHGSDVEDIVRLVELARDQPDSRAVDLVELLVDLRSGEPAMVAVVGSDLVGVVVASIAGDTARIDVLVIAPAWRHQGMGSALLRSIGRRKGTARCGGFPGRTITASRSTHSAHRGDPMAASRRTGAPAAER